MTLTLFRPPVAFSDSRGDITNLVEANIQHVTLITCKTGAIRANHVHTEDSHYTYMLEGSMEYYEIDPETGQRDYCIVRKGDIIYSPPKHPHAMKFLEPSVFLAFTTAKRDFGKYESDTKPYKVI